MSRAAIVGLVVVVAGLSGCATPARVIRQDAASVVVAVPDNTNAWPFYYQDEARSLAGGYVKDPVLVSSQRVKVGEQVTNATDTTRRDLGGQKPFGDVVTSASTTSVSDKYEYHLEYRSSSPLRGPVTLSTGSPGPAASLNPQGPPTADPNKPALTDPLQPLKLPTTPATNLPTTTIPGPGR
jgi:hypothetical protein